MDDVFKALADPTRRALLDALRRADGQTLSELETVADLSRFGVMSHLKILEAAGLVTTRRSGRFKHHYLNAVALQEVADRWIEPMIQGPTARRLLSLRNALERDMADPEKPTFVMTTYIRTTPEKLWEALHSEDQSADYHFLRASLKSERKTGGRYDQFRPDGEIMLGGEILAMDPPHALEATFEPHWTPDAATTRMRFEIEAVGEVCKLTVLHFDLPADETGIKDGWARFAASLKSYLETGSGIDFAA